MYGLADAVPPPEPVLAPLPPAPDEAPAVPPAPAPALDAPTFPTQPAREVAKTTNANRCKRGDTDRTVPRRSRNGSWTAHFFRSRITHDVWTAPWSGVAARAATGPNR